MSHPLFHKPTKKTPQAKLEGTRYRITADNESEAKAEAVRKAEGPYRQDVKANSVRLVGTGAANIPIYEVGVSWIFVPPGAVRKS